MGSGVQASRAGHVVRVRRELLASCMTCPLCHKLLRDATTVSECLHTFCRKCILKKITDEEVDSCPICHIDLGIVPAEKLRPDHNLQDIRNKIFPLKFKKTGVPEPPTLPLPVRRKERSLSSLVVTAPRVSSQSLTGRRTKHSRRFGIPKGVTSSSGNDNFTPNKKSKVEEKDEKNVSAPSRFSKSAHNKKQNNLDPETSNKEKSNGGETELWKPLNCLLEAATRTKTLKTSPQIKEENEIQIIDPKNNNNNGISNPSIRPKLSKEEKRSLKDEDNLAGPSNLMDRREMLAKGKKVIRRKKERATSAQKMFGVVSGGGGGMRNQRMGPIWFSLVATANREGGGQLPQLSSSYLRVRDGDMKVSSIQKYIMKKLNLASEEEVEIVCRGQPVGPTMSLHGLIDLWLKSETSNRTHTMVGTPAKDFIMVLAYRHRPPPAPPLVP